MAFSQIQASQTDAKSVIDEQLFDTGVRLNFDDHESRILALESSGGGGGSIAAGVDPRYGVVEAGFESNEPKFFRRRFHYNQNLLKVGNELKFVIDSEVEKILKNLWIGFEQNADKDNFTTNIVTSYRATDVSIPKDDFVNFKVPRGMNFFGLGIPSLTTTSDSVTVTINGNSITTEGLVDENGDARSDTFSPVGATNFRYKTEWFFGLDPNEENYIKITNTDSGTDTMNLDFVEIGFKSNHFAIDKILHVEPGRVTVRGTSVTTSASDLTASATTSHGRTDSIVVNNSGTVSLLEGIEGAFTQAQPEVQVDFSSAVTSITCKNVNQFPSTGFCLFQNPFGYKTMFSYNAKTGDLLGSLDGILWEAQPQEDFTPLSNFDSTTEGEMTGDLMIALWGAGGHNIQSSTNEDIDFQITLNGTQTSHTASLSAGLYSADIVSLGKAIVDALQTAKALTNAEYFAEYNEISQRWVIGVRGDEVSEFQLLNSSGSNSATNLLVQELGFASSDLTGAKEYRATSAVQSMAHKIYRADPSFWRPTHPNIKTNFEPELLPASFDSLVENLRFATPFYSTDTTDLPYVEIYTDPDACGIELFFPGHSHANMIQVMVDDGHALYAINPTSLSTSKTAEVRNNIYSTFIPFPRGSKKISILQDSRVGFKMHTNAIEFVFLGAVQYFTRPKIEALTLDQSVVRAINVSPPQRFMTYYEDNYTPQASNDNIDTITYNGGGWTNGTTSTGNYNQQVSSTTVQNEFVDVTFTLAGQGGFAIKMPTGNVTTRYWQLYLVAGATGSNNASDLVQATTGNYTNVLWDFDLITIDGLPAGQYTARLRNQDSTGTNFANISAFGIIDSIQPDEGFTTADLSNTGQAVSFPMDTIKTNIQLDSEHLLPNDLFRSGVREGIAFNDQSISVFSEINVSQASSVFLNNYYFSAIQDDGQNDYFKTFFFGKSVCTFDPAFTAFGTSVQSRLDGIDTANSANPRQQVKGGSAPSLTRTSTFPLFQRHYKEDLSSDMSDSTTMPIANTKGFKVGMLIQLEADSQPTLTRTIATVTADTNITVTEAVSTFANYTTANNALVRVYGFHAIRVSNDATTDTTMELSAIAYEPMFFTPSRDEEMRLASRFDDKIEVAHNETSGVSNGSDLSFPVYLSDGQKATWEECSVQVIAYNQDSAAEELDFSIPKDLKSISVQTNDTMDVKITAVRSRR